MELELNLKVGIHEKDLLKLLKNNIITRYGDLFNFVYNKIKSIKNFGDVADNLIIEVNIKNENEDEDYWIDLGNWIFNYLRNKDEK